jgi:polar amino acid transport system substrate-binding protein
MKTIAIAVLGAALLAGCSTGGVDTIDASGALRLRVGVAPDLPPYVYRQGREMAGIEAEFAHALGAELKRPVRFVDLNWTDLIPALEGGVIDIIMSGMCVTDSRAQRVAFCKPYLKVGQMVLVRAPDAIRYRYPQVVLMSEARIGVEKDSTADFLVQGGAVDAKRIPYTSLEKAVRDLTRKKIDAFVHDGPVVLTLAAQHKGDGVVAMRGAVTEEYLAWAVRPDDPELMKSVRAIQDRWDRDGTADRIIRDGLPFVGR